MKALVFHKPRDVRVEQVPDPKLEHPRDAILRVTSTAICGSDLHIYNGFFPQKQPMVLGHEFMGVVEEVGRDVKNLAPGDRVVVPFPIACGDCFFCERGLPPHCEKSNPKHYGPEGALLGQKGGGLFGYTDLYGGYQGGQAERVRVPFADYGPRKVPEGVADETVLFLTDILSTGWSGVRWADPKGGETVAVFGCGPVGLMTMKAAWALGAERVIGVDILPYRLEVARRTARAETIDAREADPVEVIRDTTRGRGADIVVDAVGLEADRTLLDRLNAALHFEAGSIKVLLQCFSAARRGGTVSILGVYGTPVHGFPIGQVFDKGLRINSGQALVHRYIDELMELLTTGRLQADDIISHRLPLAEAARGYRVFNDKEESCVKVVLKP
jgi:S-(hydroxymethyl)glutathione dehydrogenase / alcohol dehydrogenase